MKDQIEVPVSAPAHWTTKPLGEVATVVNGGTPKSKVAAYWGNDVQWLTPKDMGKLDGREIAATPRTISETGLAKSSARLVPPQSVILSTRAPIGHLAINSVPMAFNQGCRGIIPGASLDHVFLYHFLAANRQRLDDLGSGTTFKELSGTSLKGLKIPLPPLEEQKRIVAVLDQAFAALDRARAHAEANLADAERLLSGYLNSTFDMRNVPCNECRQISEAFQTSTGSTPPKTEKALFGRDVPFVKPPELNDATVGDTQDGLSTLGKQRARLAPAKSILVSCIGNLGKIGILDRESAFNQQINAILPDQSKANPDFVFYQCRSASFKEQLEARAGGTTVSIVNKKQFNSILFWLPSLRKQAEIVDKSKVMEELSVELRHIYGGKLGEISDLRQSLLQKAFSGRLTA